MLVTCLSLGEEIDNLKLSREVVEGNNLIMNRTLSEVGIHTNVLGQLILDRISSNLKSPVLSQWRVGDGTETIKSCSIQRSQITS